MQKFIALLLVGALLGSLPAVPAFAAELSNQPLCGPDAPESYKRPGGYCEQLGQNLSAASDSEEMKSEPDYVFDPHTPAT